MKKQNKFVIAIVLFTALLMLPNLAERPFWGDEAIIATFSKSVLENGYVKIDNPSLYGNEEQLKVLIKPGHNTWIANPWLEDYIIAFSFLIFGQNTLAAKIPFAIFGILTVLMLYIVALKLTKDKSVALLSMFLLATNIAFYLEARTARYFALSMLLSLVIFHAYLRLLENKKYSKTYFCAALVASFYITYLLFFSFFLAIAIHFVLFKFNKKTLKKLLICSGIIFILTFPWFMYASVSSQVHDYSLSRILFSFFYISAHFFLYIFPIIFCIFIPKIIYNSKKKKFNNQYMLLLIAIICTFFILSFSPQKLSPFHYFVFMMPVSIILLSKALLIIKKYSKYIAFLVLLLLIFTNYLFVIPFKIFEPLALQYTPEKSSSYLFIKENLELRYLLFDHIYELTHDYESPTEAIINFLKENSKEGETLLTGEVKTFMLYTDVTYYEKDSGKLPDWIIPRKPHACDDKEVYAYVTSMIDEEKYEKTILNVTDYVDSFDMSHPRLHRFKENKELTTRDYIPCEFNPIEIYRLKEQYK